MTRVFVNGSPSEIEVQQLENFAEFQAALLASSFATWANQSPSHAAAISANFVTRDFDAVRIAYAQLAALYPPTLEHLQAWQQIADQHNIVSLRFIPYAQPQ